MLAVAVVPLVIAACGSSSSSASSSPSMSTAASPAMSPAATADVVDTAVAAGNFKTLVAAVQAAGLVETLKGEGPFTVFAPTDEAFAKLPAGSVEMLLLPPTRTCS